MTLKKNGVYWRKTPQSRWICGAKQGMYLHQMKSFDLINSL